MEKLADKLIIKLITVLQTNEDFYLSENLPSLLTEDDIFINDSDLLDLVNKKLNGCLIVKDVIRTLRCENEEDNFQFHDLKIEINGQTKGTQN